MKRKLLIALFAFGTVAGFGSGIASMACWHGRAHARRAAFERHVAEVCLEAAQGRADQAYDRPTPPPPDRPHRDRGPRHPHSHWGR